MSTWTEATVTINGMPGGIATVTYEQDKPKGVTIRNDRAFECSGEMTIRGELYEEFVSALFPRPRGASNMTLAKRATYGGRKARSALRRLSKQGFVGIMRIDGSPPMPCPPMTIACQLNGAAYAEARLREATARMVDSLSVATATGEDLDRLAGLLGFDPEVE